MNYYRNSGVVGDKDFVEFESDYDVSFEMEVTDLVRKSAAMEVNSNEGRILGKSQVVHPRPSAISKIGTKFSNSLKTYAGPQRSCRLRCIFLEHCKHLDDLPRSHFRIQKSWLSSIRKALPDQSSLDAFDDRWHDVKSRLTLCSIHFDEADINVLGPRSFVRQGRLPKYHLSFNLSKSPPATFTQSILTDSVESNPKTSVQSQSPTSNSKENSDEEAEKRQISNPVTSTDESPILLTESRQNPQNEEQDSLANCDATENSNSQVGANEIKYQEQIKNLTTELSLCKKKLKEKENQNRKLENRIDKLETTMNVVLEFLTECKANKWTVSRD